METTDKKEPKKTTTKKKSNSTFNKGDGIFFIIVCIGLIIFTIILVHKNTANKRTFQTDFGENAYSTITLQNDKNIQLDVYVDKEQVSSQKGEYHSATETDAYIIDIEDTEDNIQMNIKDDTLTLIYDDNTSVTYKEK